MTDSSVYVLHLPTDSLAAAVRVAVKAKHDLAKMGEERAKMVVTSTAHLPADRQGRRVTLADAQAIMERGSVGSTTVTDEEVARVREFAGEPGVQRFREQVEQWEQRRAEVIAAAQAQLDNLHKQAVAYIDAETTPDGRDLANEQGAGDARLLEFGIIDTPDELAALLSRHDGSVVFRKLAAKYALEHGWQHFEGITKEASIRQFVDQIFDGLGRGVAVPGGISAEQYIGTTSEIERIATAFDLVPEWVASDGGRITKAYTS